MVSGPLLCLFWSYLLEYHEKCDLTRGFELFSGRIYLYCPLVHWVCGWYLMNRRCFLVKKWCCLVGFVIPKQYLYP